MDSFGAFFQAAKNIPARDVLTTAVGYGLGTWGLGTPVGYSPAYSPVGGGAAGDDTAFGPRTSNSVSAERPTGSTDCSGERRVSAVRFACYPTGAWTIGLVAKRTYRVARGALVEADEQIPLVEEPVFGPDEAVLLHDTDLLLNRTAADVIVQGHAYAHSGQSVFDAGVGIESFARVVRVFGDRRVEWHPSRLRFTSPQPVDKVPLGWERAYGGSTRLHAR